MSTTGALRIKLPMPHAGQRHVLNHRRRTTWLCAGRRWRKTTLCVSLMVEAALRSEQIIWGAPTYDQTWTAWEETQRACRGVASFHQGRMTATLGRGSMLFRSLDDPDNARSKTADGIVIDEAADVAEEAYVEVLLPMLMDTGGWLISAGTPKGRNWFWRECMAAQQHADSVLFQAPSLGVRITSDGLERAPHPLENPALSFTEIEHLFRTMPERTFRQEILAEFVEDGAVFRFVHERAAAAAQPTRLDGHEYVMGCDWGKTQDFTWLTIVDMMTGELVAQDRFNQIDYAVQIDRLQALYDRFKPIVIMAEQNSIGMPIIEQLWRRELPVQPFVTTNATKARVIEDLLLAFEQGTIKILNDPILIAELQAFAVKKTALGLPQYGAPDGMHDDGVMSLALAWSAARPQEYVR